MILNIDPDEIDRIKAMYDELKKAMNDPSTRSQMLQSWSNSIPTLNGNNPPSPSPWGSMSTFSSNSMSPTDHRANGVYPYQEPEVDEQGTYYGYKVLHRHCERPDCFGLISPNYPAQWSEDGELDADRRPDAYSMFGIHFTKSPNNRELGKYVRNSDFRYRMYGEPFELWYLVKCALSGTIVETEQGFRAQHAQIIGVHVNGNWQSYQDYRERTQSYSRSDPSEAWRYKGRWNDFDPSAYYTPTT